MHVLTSKFHRRFRVDLDIKINMAMLFRDVMDADNVFLTREATETMNPPNS